MEQTREAITTNLAERWCWQVARREDRRVARRLYRKPLVDGVSPLEAGAWLEEFVPCLQELGVVAWLEDVRGPGIEREMGPMVPDGLLYGLKSLCGRERMKALPEWLFRDEASRRLGGFKAHHVRYGVYQRGAATRPGPRPAGPIGPEALANHLVKLDWRAVEALFNGAIRALAAAGDGLAVGHRVPTTRHGQGRAAWTERLKTEGVGITGLTTDDQEGTPEPGRPAHRRDFQANPINAVVVRQWRGKDDGPGGNTVWVTKAPVEKPWQPCDDDDDRRLIEHGCLKEAKQPWELGHPPQKHDRAERVHVVFTRLMFALATAYRLQGEREAMGDEPVGWQRWRRPLLQQNRAQVIVCAQGDDGIFPMAEFALLLGVKRQEVPPGIGTHQEVLATYALTSHD